jgi:hypothetical protein
LKAGTTTEMVGLRDRCGECDDTSCISTPLTFG